MDNLTNERAVWLAQNVLPHEPALRAWLKRWRQADLEVDDIVQEAYAVLASKESVDGIRNPKTYCFQVARSIILMHLRRSRVVSILAVENLDRLDVSADEPNAEQSLSNRQEMQQLAQAIASLPRPRREALLLVVQEGLSHREVGRRLGISENAAQKKIAKSIYALMEFFGRGGKVGSGASNNENEEIHSRAAGARNKYGD